MEVIPDVNKSEIRISSYALDENISREEAERRLAIMDEAYKAFPEMEDYLRDSMTGSYFDFQNDKFSLNVRTTLKQEIPSILDQQLMQSIKDKTGLPITMHFNSIKNAESINNMLENEAATMFSNIEGIQGFGYNPKKDMVSLYVYEPNEHKQAEWLNNESMKQVSGMNVEIIFEAKPITTTAMIGGAHLNTFPANLFYDDITHCTAGYSATRYGVQGVITAAHCGNTNNELGTELLYVGRNRNDKFKMILTGYDSNPNTGKYHDLAFFAPDDKSIRALPLYFPEPSAVTEPAYSAATAGVGTYICHYGKATGTSCGKVTDTYFSNPNTQLSGKGCASSGPCASTFVRVEGAGLRCDGGDSGGPAYGSVPYGIVSACAKNTIGNASLVYSPLRFASYIDAIPLVTQ